MKSDEGSGNEVLPEIYVDWNDMWGKDLVDINIRGSVESFEKLGLTPRVGLRIRVRGEDLAANAVIVSHQEANGGSPFLVAKLTEPLHEVPWE